MQNKYLIICPASIKANWAHELRKFLNTDFYELFGEMPSKIDMAHIMVGKYKFFLANYDAISTKMDDDQSYVDEDGQKHEKIVTRFPWIELFNMGKFTLLILDEAHKIKNTNSNRSQAVSQIQTPHTIELTGTPLLNRPSELHPLLKKVCPEVAGSFEGFKRKFSSSDGKYAVNIPELRTLLKPVMIRRTKKDVMKELPPINRIPITLELPSSIKPIYKKALEGLWLGIDSWDGSTSHPQHIQSLLAQLIKLKQICAHAKVEAIADLASELHDSMNGEQWNKVIVFTQFVNSPPIVHDIARRLEGEGVLELTGEHDPADRFRIVEQFQTDPKVNFLIASIMAAGEGLNITKAGSVIFNDLTWTPANHHQAEGRAYGRVSDPHPITSYYPIYEDTIEEDISELLLLKMELFNEIIEGTETSRDTGIAMELLKRLKEKRFSA